MDPMTAFLFAMQAAGLITSFYGANQQQKMIQLGRKLEKAQLETNLQAIKTESLEGSVDEIKQLRSNMSSQVAINAARGNSRGSSAWGLIAAQGAFESDERKRRMNLLAKESELRAGGILSGLHSLQAETTLGQNLLSKTFDQFQTTTLMGPKANTAATSRAATAETKKWVNPDNFQWGY